MTPGIGKLNVQIYSEFLKHLHGMYQQGFSLIRHHRKLFIEMCEFVNVVMCR